MKRLLFCLSLVVLQLTNGAASIKLPALFNDGMVLQRNQPILIWGWADANETITVQLGKKSCTVVADADGNWRAELPKMKAGGPFELRVQSSEFRVKSSELRDATSSNDSHLSPLTSQLVIKDVYIGDVWLCSGQSNVDIHIERVYPQYKDELDQDNNPMVRLFQVANVPNAAGPQRDVRSQGWKKLTKDNAWHFSALGYFLGKRMQKETGVAQGIIQSSWGGTPIEAWLPADSMMQHNPMMMMDTRYYQDQELVRAINTLNNRASQRWRSLLDEADPGMASASGNTGKTEPLFASLSYDDSQWTEASQYRLPVKPGRFCGTYWVRQHVRLDASQAGKPVQLLLGTLFDADNTYVNGQLVGQTGYQYPPRRYQVPEGLLREGDNVIAIRFVNQNGRPSFTPEKPYKLGDIQLSENWLVHEGVQMVSQPGVGLSMQNKASTLWNGMLCGLAPYRLSGVVWYQGESNTGQPKAYEPLLKCLMRSWRQLFEQPDLPFTIVQLANYMAPSEQPQQSNWAQLRESQHRAALSDSRAELAVAIDLGEAVDIHPLLKKEVAERCAQCFDRLVFGKKVLLAPEVTQTELNAEGQLVITFDQELQAGPVRGFELAGQDGKFSNVSAMAQGRTVTLEAKAGATTVRYAFKDNPIEANVRSNTTAIPAVPFERKL